MSLEWVLSSSHWNDRDGLGMTGLDQEWRDGARMTGMETGMTTCETSSFCRSWSSPVITRPSLSFQWDEDQSHSKLIPSGNDPKMRIISFQGHSCWEWAWNEGFSDHKISAIEWLGMTQEWGQNDGMTFEWLEWDFNDQKISDWVLNEGITLEW